MRDIPPQLDELLDHLRSGLGLGLGRVRAWRRRRTTGRRAELLFIQQRDQRQEFLITAWRAAWPLLVYVVGFLLAESITWLLAFALSPKVEGSSPLFIQGAVAVFALLLVSPKRWWIYLFLTL